uniref:Uncharacterized protein n=1 Tax=Cucumis melo TaxID=3656 RepID=A0A9I9DKR7_CUCME
MKRMKGRSATAGTSHSVSGTSRWMLLTGIGRAEPRESCGERDLGAKALPRPSHSQFLLKGN